MSEQAPEVMALVPVEPKPFDMGHYLDGVANDRSIQAQQQLVVAYDRAVRALVGPNDVQKDGGKEFKKKSAWRKLARYFNISTEIVREDTQRDEEGHIVSTVIMRGIAPWGQHVEAIAKCSTREPRFARNRSKADHDCPATAQTRAANRVIADLIAAGEVSAEEMEFGDVSEPLDVSLEKMYAQVDAETAEKARQSVAGGADKRKVLTRLTEIAMNGGAK
jgi:hypothetical protein